MRHFKQLIAMLLSFVIACGSAAAIANPNPEITSVKSRGGYVLISTNWAVDYAYYSYNGSDDWVTDKSGDWFEDVDIYRNGNRLISRPGKRVYVIWGRETPIRDHGVKNGTFYTYQVYTTLAKEGTTQFVPIARSNKVSIYYLSKITQPITVKNSSSGKTMTLSWSRNSKADGYQVQYTTKEDWSSRINRKVKGNKNTTLTLKNRTPGKQYMIRVRSYKKYKGKTYYSAWSDVQTRYETDE